MRKSCKIIAVALVLGVFVYMASLVSDKKQLSNDILRLHVVGASNSQADQAVKLEVRDAVLQAVEHMTVGVNNKEEAEQCLSENLHTLEMAQCRFAETWFYRSGYRQFAERRVPQKGI